uniref:Uncharacterized protein n=1 Tax=Anopheles minimus TaxID=112268 RepID=A0A182VSP4_9DIPT
MEEQPGKTATKWGYTCAVLYRPTGFDGFGVDHASLPALPTVGIRFVSDSNVGTGNVSSGVRFLTGLNRLVKPNHVTYQLMDTARILRTVRMLQEPLGISRTLSPNGSRYKSAHMSVFTIVSCLLNRSIISGARYESAVDCWIASPTIVRQWLIGLSTREINKHKEPQNVLQNVFHLQNPMNMGVWPDDGFRNVAKGLHHFRLVGTCSKPDVRERKQICRAEDNEQQDLVHPIFTFG